MRRVVGIVASVVFLTGGWLWLPVVHAGEPLQPDLWTGARAAALGGADTVVIGSTDGLFGNPAAMAFVLWPETGVGLSSDGGAVRHLGVLGAYPLSGRLVLGAGVVRFLDDGADQDGTLLQGALGFPLSKDGSLIAGLGGKWMQRSVAGQTYVGGGLDFGLLYTVYETSAGQALRFGLTMLDPRTLVKSSTEELAWPSRFGFGAAYHFSLDTMAVLAYDLLQSKDEILAGGNTVRAGLEHLVPLEKTVWLALRGGVQHEDQRDVVTAGFGVEAGDWKLDYAVQAPLDGTPSHAVSLSWGPRREALSRERTTLAESGEAPREASRKNEQTMESHRSIFSALASAAEIEDVSVFQFDQPSRRGEARADVKPTPEPERETETYRVSIPQSPADRERMSAGVDPEMPAFFSSRFSGISAGGQPLNYSNQDVRVSAVVNPFSPNGDGRFDQTIFVGRLTTSKFEPTRWVLNIFHGSDIVRTFKGGTRLPRNLGWDGRDERGKPLPEGTYQVLLRVLDENGMELASATDTLELRLKPRTINLSGPATVVLAGGRSEKAVEFSLPAVKGSSDWRFMVTSRDGRRMLERSGSKEIPTTLSWTPGSDGKPVGAGTYEARLTFRDDAGIRATALTTLRVQQADFNLILGASPEVFRPQARGGQGVVFSPKAQGELTVTRWTLTITREGEQRPVRVLKGSGLPGSVPWNGIYDDGRTAEAGKAYHAELSVVTDLGAEASAESPPLQCDLGDYAGTQALSINLVRVLFDVGGGRLTDTARGILSSAAETLKKYNNDYQLRIAGHCDKDEAGGEEVELSRTRAREVADYLIQQAGIPKDKIETIGLGSGKRLVQEGDEEARAKNRRVEVVLFAK